MHPPDFLRLPPRIKLIWELTGISGESDKFQPRLIEIQDFLFALGKEARDENAEWLLLHRARPLEPVRAV